MSLGLRILLPDVGGVFCRYASVQLIRFLDGVCLPRVGVGDLRRSDDLVGIAVQIRPIHITRLLHLLADIRGLLVLDILVGVLQLTLQGLHLLRQSVDVAADLVLDDLLHGVDAALLVFRHIRPHLIDGVGRRRGRSHLLYASGPLVAFRSKLVALVCKVLLRARELRL